MLSCLSQEAMSWIKRDHGFGSEGVTDAFRTVMSSDGGSALYSRRILGKPNFSKPVFLTCKMVVAVVIVIIFITICIARLL